MPNTSDHLNVLKHLKEIGYKIRLLIVEDDEDVRESLLSIFSRFFSDIDCAQNGTEALFLYEEKKHDLIITDIMMPEMSGIDFIHALHEKHASAKVIVISGQNEQEILMELIHLGVDGFIQKPFDLNHMITQIDKTCAKIHDQEMSNYLSDLLENMNKELREDLKALRAQVNSLKAQEPSITDPSAKLPDSPAPQAPIHPAAHPQIYVHSEKMSAVDLHEAYPFELDRTNEDLEALEDRFNYVSLNAKRSSSEKVMKDLILIIRNYAKIIEMIPQFSALSFAIQELACTFEAVQDKADVSTILPMLGGLFNNLEQWRRQIFYYRNVDDIHYMDHSILSDATSLRTIVEGSASQSQSDHFEFF